ncbi:MULTISPECIES: SDR family oxidoreductase [Streptomyces]|uniref:SDR family NAD(P)-dependent oxidoreductase n=1 Tax=Streptomyces dengpaensis TaxID=2049881 RepID=A0ABN5HZ69_9ACTN|nr:MULTISPECIES: SDR family oxidoreductase [Streptomyces]AVH54647.1 SDR family NAD(P)-dependent oxidoreductase [Streptomyces dengpaensis]PIB05180.1 oxidoreductase [Streptomyces sp. HG99]
MNSTTQSPDRKIVLVTGASGGIGEATTRNLAAAGHQVVLGARRVDRLDRLVTELTEAGHRAESAQLDVTDRDSVNAFVAGALERHGRVDVLVNNAGVMPLGLMEELRVDEWDQMIDVNLRGVLHGIAGVLPSMRERRSGHIINVASTAAHRVDPTGVVYCATKFAVRAVSEGLRQETADLRVTVVSPGLTKTELTHSGGNPEQQNTVRSALEAVGIDASAIAQAIGYAIAQPADVNVNEVIVQGTAQL